MSAEPFPHAYRTECGSVGKFQVPRTALYGALIARVVQDFPNSGMRMPRDTLRALGFGTAAGARVNDDLGLLGNDRVRAH